MAESYFDYDITTHDGGQPLMFISSGGKWVDVVVGRFGGVASVYDSRNDGPLRQESIRKLLDGADLALFWIDDESSQETLVELGMAIGQKPPHRLVFGVDKNATIFEYLSNLEGLCVHTDFEAMLIAAELKLAEMCSGGSSARAIIGST
jgi:hypothetical protein